MCRVRSTSACRGIVVVVLRALRGRAACEQSAVEHPGRDDPDTALFTDRQQVVERRLLEQGVAACEHEHVHVGVAGEVGQHLSLVHARADCRDDALPAQLLERRVGAIEDLASMLVGVVEIDDVNGVHAEPLEALLQRPQDAVATEVPDAPMGCRPSKPSSSSSPTGLNGSSRRPTFVDTTYSLRGRLCEGRAEATLGEPEPVVGRGVEVADPVVPGGIDRRVGLLVGDRPVEVAEL